MTDDLKTGKDLEGVVTAYYDAWKKNKPWGTSINTGGVLAVTCVTTTPTCIILCYLQCDLRGMRNRALYSMILSGTKIIQHQSYSQYWQNYTARSKTQYLGKNLFVPQCLLQIPYGLDWPGIEPGPLWWGNGDLQHELCHAPMPEMLFWQIH